MSVTVRPATRADARAIAEFALKLFEQHRGYDPARFADIADVDGAEAFYGSLTESWDTALLVAETDGRRIGFAYLQYEQVNYADLLTSAARLHDIYVDESHRGSGAGQALVEAVVEKARSFGAEKLVLSVAAKNEAANEFFEGRGFRVTMHERMLELIRASQDVTNND